MGIRRSVHGLVVILALGALAGALPAQAAVPGSVSFQGLLLDAAGAPLTGTVSLDFSLFDAAAGGSPLWSESHPGIAVQDGVYQVALGSSVPLPQAVLVGGSLWLEVEVDGEVLAPRQRLLAVPYALRAAEAETAQNAAGVNGLSGLFVTEIFEHFNWDGGNPPATDPREGLADVDGDGIANFIDSDNDGDLFSDVQEISMGSDINLVTPAITSRVPSSADAFALTTVTVQGVNFQPGLSVQFGTQSPAPQNLTSTSFQVVVGPQPVGTATVTVTLPNGEHAGTTFSFITVVPTIASIAPKYVPFDQITTITVTGTNFAPGMTAEVGAQTPTAHDVTATGLKLDVGPQPPGTVQLRLVHPNGSLSNALSFSFVNLATIRKVFVTSVFYGGNLGGIAGADARCNARAAAAGRTETYVAWIADDTTSPAARFAQNVGPYLLADGTIVAAAWSDLTDGTLLAPINQTESGVVLAGGSVWTDVATNGNAASVAPSGHCNGWTSQVATDSGGRGNLGSTDALWTQQPAGACTVARALYCFEAN